VPPRGRRRREGTRWFADIHATPQAYHASPDAAIHWSVRKGLSPNFALTEFSAPLCQAALLEGACESATRLLRHRRASLRGLPSASFLR